jgi:hypothetical protein
MRSLVFCLCVFSSFVFCGAQPQFSDTSRDLRTIAQGAKFRVGVSVYNPDTFPYKLKLQHICGCTEFEKSFYDLPARERIFLPVTYHSSGNKGQVERGYFVQYSSENISGKIKIQFKAFVDTAKPFTTPVIDSAFCYRFDRTYIYCGDIPMGPSQRFVYLLYNCSAKPLVITNVNSSCGCTTPTWPRDPVLPGQTVEIIATYGTEGRPGSFTKTLHVHLIDGAEITLTLSGKVILQKDTHVRAAQIISVEEIR